MLQPVNLLNSPAPGLVINSQGISVQHLTDMALILPMGVQIKQFQSQTLTTGAVISCLLLQCGSSYMPATGFNPFIALIFLMLLVIHLRNYFKNGKAVVGTCHKYRTHQHHMWQKWQNCLTVVYRNGGRWRACRPKWAYKLSNRWACKNKSVTPKPVPRDAGPSASRNGTAAPPAGS
jgi:hypothetical protein